MSDDSCYNASMRKVKRESNFSDSLLYILIERESDKVYYNSNFQ